MLERMDEFFNARLNGYEWHQLNEIVGAAEFYPFTAACLPTEPDAAILDLGCGTGLELDFYLQNCPTARITGIDVAKKLLEQFKEKHKDKNLTLIHGSYLDLPLGESVYRAAVSVESLHHFTKREKIALYRKLKRAILPGGYFILTDYFADSDETEDFFMSEYSRLKREQALGEALYHYDTPLTVAHETEALLEAGFTSVKVLKQWAATCTLRAE